MESESIEKLKIMFTKEEATVIAAALEEYIKVLDFREDDIPIARVVLKAVRTARNAELKEAYRLLEVASEFVHRASDDGKAGE
jgi:hypothetical protein